MKFDFFKNVLSRIVNSGENRVLSRNIHKGSSPFLSHRSLRLETLEERQLLSVAPNHLDLSLNDTEEQSSLMNSETTISIPITEALTASNGDSSSTSEGTADNYVVIFSGGYDAENNYHRYYDVINELYTTVTSIYNVDPKNIFILYADGTDPAKDQNLVDSNENPLLINSDMSFATDNGTSVSSATYENFLSVMQYVGGKMDGNDHLLLYTSDHGSGKLGDSKTIGEELIFAWGKSIKGKRFADAVFNVQAGYVTVIETQCFSGGILSNIIDPETGEPVQETNAHWYGMAAANHYEYSYAKMFFNGLNKYLINHNATTAITVDAFSYAKLNDECAPKFEVYANNEGVYTFGLEHPWGVGESFAIFAALQLTNPKNVSATVEETTCSVQWSAVNHATGYTVQYRLADSEGEWSDATVSGTNAIFMGESGASYSVRVKAIGNNADYSDSAFSNIRVTIPAMEPTQLIAPAHLMASASETTISVNWDAVSESAGYRVQYRQTGVEEEWSNAKVIGRTATFTGKSQTGYSVRVQALGDKTVYTDSNFSETTVITGIENHAENYIVLFNGGMIPEDNNRISYDTIKSIYNTAIDLYDVNPQNVYVFNSDGTDETPDMNIGIDNTILINSDMTFATDKGSQVYSANYDDFLLVLKEIGSKMDDNDHLLLFTSDHGGGIFGDPTVQGEEILSGWGEQKINCEQFKDALFNITKGYVTIILTECFSGGMLASVIDPDTGVSLNPNISKEDATTKWFGMAATNHYEYAYYNYDKIYSEEYQQYIQAEGGFDFSIGIIKDLEQEIDVTTTIFNDAKLYDPFKTDEIYANNEGRIPGETDYCEHSWRAGATFSIFAKDESNKLSTPEKIEASANENGISVCWDAVEYATDYTLEYCAFSEKDWTVITNLQETTYVLSDLIYDSIYNIRVRAVDSTETWKDSNYAETWKTSNYAETTFPSPLSEWNLTEEFDSYSEFRVDATSLAAYLYGTLDNEEIMLKEVPIAKGSDLTILGDNRLLTISAGAMTYLGTLTFKGKSGQLTVEGSDNMDLFTIGRKTIADEQDVANPYKVTNRNLTGVTYETVTLARGATLLFSGVRQVTIDAKEENDIFYFSQFRATYNLVGGDGEDRIDFSNASRSILNMGATYKQHAVSGQIGSFKLNGDIEQIVGSTFNDVIISANNTSYIGGCGGSDSLILKGDAQTITTVELTGQNQNVVMRGDGSFLINIEGGTGSAINAASVSATGFFYLYASGDHLHVYGSASDDIVNVFGNNAIVYGNDGDDFLNIIGSNAIVHGNNGDDKIIVSRADGQTSEKNFVYGDAGNDTINLRTTDGMNYAYAGSGNDILIGSDGVDYLYAQSGDNVLIGYEAADWLYGGSGRDLLIANTTRKLEEGYAREEEEFYNQLAVAWFAGNDIIELIGVTSTSDNDRDRLYRGSGKNNVLYSNESDNDYAHALTKDPFNDQWFTEDDEEEI